MFCAKSVRKMPWTAQNRFVQRKKMGRGRDQLLPTATTGYGCPLRRPVIRRNTFSALAPFLVCQPKSWVCHLLPLFMAVGMIPTLWHSSGCCMRHLWLTKFGVLCLNQLVQFFVAVIALPSELKAVHGTGFRHFVPGSFLRHWCCS